MLQPRMLQSAILRAKLYVLECRGSPLHVKGREVKDESMKERNLPVAAEDGHPQPESRDPIVIEALLGLVAEIMENAAPYILVARRQRVRNFFQAHRHLPHRIGHDRPAPSKPPACYSKGEESF